MRPMSVLLALLVPQAAAAAVVNVPGESLAPVNADDWSIPLRRCFLSSEFGAGVYEGAERCAVELALPLPAGKNVARVRALYEDDQFNPEVELSMHVRDTASGDNFAIAYDKDFSPGTMTSLNALTLEPKYKLGPHDAPFVLVEVRGDTRLLTLTYEYE
jgi:hypothetical protein